MAEKDRVVQRVCPFFFPLFFLVCFLFCLFFKALGYFGGLAAGIVFKLSFTDHRENTLAGNPFVFNSKKQENIEDKRADRLRRGQAGDLLTLPL